MGDDKGCGIIVAALLFFCAVSFVVGLKIGEGYGAREMRRQAVSAGVAEYVANQKTGGAEFRWKFETSLGDD